MTHDTSVRRLLRPGRTASFASDRLLPFSPPERSEPSDSWRAGIEHVALIGTFMPRRCGIASFTGDLARAVAADGDVRVGVVAVNDCVEGYDYSRDVCWQIDADDPSSYVSAAKYLNGRGVDAVGLQHEFGIYGGPAGGHILGLLEILDVPVVTTLHTVLEHPNDDQLAVMQQLGRLSDRFVVMSRKAVSLLSSVYGIDATRIEVIHHGIPDVAFGDPDVRKPLLGLEGRSVLLTFGLIGPGKGLEYAIAALPAIVKRHPDLVYAIVGATHPNLLAREGEEYRDSLSRLARGLGVERNVVFFNRFVDAGELKVFLTAADVYLTPYPRIEQICSGTLAYALGAGNAIVSTPYWHAQELLADGRGSLVPPKDPAAIGRAVLAYLDDPALRQTTRNRAYRFGRQMTWPEVGRRYVAAIDRARDGAHVPSVVVSV